jgi:hypothetical protein
MIRSTTLLMILGQLTWSCHASAQTGDDTTKTHDEAMVNKSQSPDKQLAHDWLFDLAADLEPPLRIGPTPDGMRQIEYVRGGSFQGPSMLGSTFAMKRLSFSSTGPSRSRRNSARSPGVRLGASARCSTR